MKTTLQSFIIAATVMLMTCSAETAPDQPTRTVSLAGTTWSGTDSDGDSYVFTFRDDGILAYKSPAGSFTNGVWNQFKNSVYFQMNDHISEYLGAINGNKIEGKAWNNKHRAWLWTVTRNP